MDFENIIKNAQLHSGYTMEVFNGLVEKMKEWIEPSFYLVSEKYDELSLEIVTGGIEEKGKFSYNLYRFFKLGNGWEVSVELQNMDAEEMMHELLQRNIK